jgi:hypothetical protein
MGILSRVSAETTAFDCDYKTFSDDSGLNKVEGEFRLTFLIDSSAKKAYLIGNNGSAEVHFVMNDDGFSLVEITDAGNVMVTAITNGGKSVHSRNTILQGDIVPSQYYGTCHRR